MLWLPLCCRCLAWLVLNLHRAVPVVMSAGLGDTLRDQIDNAWDSLAGNSSSEGSLPESGPACHQSPPYRIHVTDSRHLMQSKLALGTNPISGLVPYLD